MLCQPKRSLITVLLAAGGLAAASAPLAMAQRSETLDQAREHHREGRLDEAAAAYGEVLGDPAVDQEFQAVAANNLCVVLDVLGELAAAEAACQRALELRSRSSDRLRLARTLNNLGLVLQHLGRYAEAEERFSEALEINRNLGEPLAQAINLANLGAVATQAGRFQKALGRQAEVIELAREHSDQPWAGEQLRTAEINRGVVLERLGAYREALEVYRGLLASARELTTAQKASILVNSGVIYRNLGDPVQAIARFEQAETIYRERGDRSGQAHAKLNVGIALHLNLNDATGAETSYREALSMVEESGDRGLGIDVLCFLGRLLVSKERLHEARSRFDEALSMARESGSVEGEWVALAGLAETERASGDLEAALGRFEEAIDLIEEGRVEVLESDHRAFFLADKRAVYSGALETLVALDGGSNGPLAARALEVAQQAKSRDLLDALENRRGRASRSEAAMSRPLTLDELVRRLGEGVLIEYFATRTQLLMWWIESGSIRLVSLGDPGPILAAAESVHRALSSGSEPSREDLDWLSNALLGPLGQASSSLQGKAGSEAVANLWIAPDRRLRYLAFEILFLGGTGASPADQTGLRLLERARISYLPSAWALPDPLATERSDEFEVGFLGFGAVDSSRRDGSGPWLSGLDLEPLPAARSELESVSRRLGGPTRILLGDDATEASFRAHAGQAVRVMHFATHTALTERRGEESAILLTQADSDDGLLTPSEIVGESPAADLVVLASCTTALGTEQDGRALTTLTGAFLAAGAGSVLATLWPVDDQSTAVFMDQFYYQLSRGRTPAEALRETKLRFLGDDRWKNPAQWSGYVLIGSGRPVVERWVPWKWLGALTLVLALAALGWRVRASKAKRMSR